MIFIGIDPGKGGAIAWIDGAGLSVIGMPESGADVRALLGALVGLRTDGKVPPESVRAVIEKVGGGMHAKREGRQMGVVSAFTFGQAVGRIYGAIEAIGLPFEVVAPQRWQKALGCMTKGDKHVSQRRARQLFPSGKVTLKNADAILLAEYCRRLFGNGSE